MKNTYSFLLLLFLFVGTSVNSQTLSGNQDITASVSYGELIIETGADIKITGNVTATDLIVQTNATFLVVGNLTVSETGGGSSTVVELIVNGTLVVTGNLFVTTNKDAETVVNATGILAVGGEYETSAGNGKKSTETESSDGALYLSDPADWGDGADSSSGNADTIEELITSGDLPDDVLTEFIEESGFDTGTLDVYNWQGDVTGSQTDWNIPNNWATGSVPGSISNVIVPSVPSGGADVFPLGCGNKTYVMWNLTLESNANLNIPEGSKVTIYGNITIGTNATLTVQNTNANPTSFIVYGSIIDEYGNPAEINFEWAFDPLHWFFIGHPISNPTMSVYRDILTDVTNPDNEYALYYYADNGSLVNLANDGSYEFDQNLSSGDKIRGYQLKVLNPTIITQTGTPNNQDSYSKTVLNGWQIIANPYPAYYQLPVDVDGTGDFANTDGTVYVYDDATDKYNAFNVFSGIGSSSGQTYFDGLIAPGQAFYIKATDAASGNISMHKTNCTHNGVESVSLKSANKKTQENTLRLKLGNELGLTDEAVIAFRSGGFYDWTKKDSEKLIKSGTNYSFIYSTIDEKKAVINVLPELLDDFQQAIGIQAKAGKHTLSIEGIDELAGNFEIVLEDKLLDISIKIDNSSIYEFTAEEGEENGRFVLHFNMIQQTELATGVEETELLDDKVKIYVQNASVLKVACNWERIEKIINIYSVNGLLVMTDDFEGNDFTRHLNLKSGLYIVEISDKVQRYRQKILLP